MESSNVSAPPAPESPDILGLTGHADAPVPRVFAAVQVFLVSGIPTQAVVFTALYLAGSPMGADGSTLPADPAALSLQFFAMLSLFDTALVAVLVRVFLALSGESSNQVFLGKRPVWREALRGLALLPVLWLTVAALTALMNVVFPSLHNVPVNPFEAYMDTPLRAAVLIVVVTLAGGVREELQRGFILHRFGQNLGGAYVGLTLYSVMFAVFHLPQGIDVAIAVGMLGLAWGVLYIRRRSVVAPMVSHAAFDVAQILQQVLLRR